MNRYDAIVIGGGAAGLMAAYTSSKEGQKTLLIEKNKMLGKKLLITGKGRCNITNACDDVDTCIRNCIHNGQFLYSSFMKFSNHDIMDFFEENNLRLKVERGQRVFPVSDKASDVVDTLINVNKEAGVNIITGENVKNLLTENNIVQGIITSKNKKIFANKVILATGGMSYPDTGSTGDGYKIAEELGHLIVKPKSGLSPIETEENWPAGIMGLSLKNVGIKFVNEKGKVIFKDFGEMLFTHFGLSGPVILSGSSHINTDKKEKIMIYIDLKPALSFEKLDNRIKRDFDIYINKQFKNSLGNLLPKNLISIIIELSKIDPEKKINQITKEEREYLVKLLKELPLTYRKLRPLKEAIVTRGGISIKEINPKTMESKLVKGLFFAGEIIDVDAYTGGFNLTIAFSTGVSAGLGK